MIAPVVVTHGGAGRVGADRLDAHVAGVARAAEAGLAVLEAGGTALDAAQRAVEAMETDPLYNAGTGGSLTEAGTLELDASLMEGAFLRGGAVCCLPPFEHPVALARALLEDGRHVMLAGEGAARFAAAVGIEASTPEAMITESAKARLEGWREGRVGEGWAGGTVGAVVCDAGGHVVAATSTGGTVGKRVGRVGDTPILGAGTWADDRTGACSCTGIGEAILRFGLARTVCEGPEASAQDAARVALRAFEARVSGEGGVIFVRPDGTVGIARNTETMSHAIARAGEATVAGH
ncbi:MAG: hypothetical protein CMN30_12120 [Sandaracinus sp.]|nr:hypothetical protein [Sandaracinus sp.]